MIDVQLNHVYLVVDRESYEALKRSLLVPSLAFTYEQKNSAEHHGSWEGFYIRGKNTYIEFFYPQERYPSVGIAGIGMGVDQKGALTELQRDHPHFQKGQFSRNGKPWFEYLATNDSYFYKRNSFWIMEYASEYFTERSEDVSRAHYNSEKYDPKKPFLDIQKVVIALKPEGLESLASCLRSLQLNREKNTYTTSENIQLVLMEEDAQREGICQIDFSLKTHTLGNQEQNLGHSRLKIAGNQGSWSFFKSHNTLIK